MRQDELIHSASGEAESVTADEQSAPPHPIQKVVQQFLNPRPVSVGFDDPRALYQCNTLKLQDKLVQYI